MKPGHARPAPMTWAGVFAVLVTPFGEDLAVVEDGLESQVAFCQRAGVAALVYPVIASEFNVLSDRERASGLGRVCAAAAGHVPVLAGVTATSTAHAVELARDARDAGASALIGMPPLNGPPASSASIIDHYGALADATKLPIMLQNAPQPLGRPLSPEVVLKVVEQVDLVEAVKEETPPNPQMLGALIASGDGSLPVMGGLGGLHLLNELARGATGTMPACQFVDVVKAILAAHARRDFDAARERFEALQPALVMEALYGMAFMKECLHRRGVLHGTRTRVGHPPLDAEDMRQLDAIWERLSPYFDTDSRT